MPSHLWTDADATALQDAAGADPMARELALRVYAARLIGRDPDLVMHGGGNVSVKLTVRDVYGDTVDVLHVKGSGWDLDTIAAPGLPAVRMAPLDRLRGLATLSDEDMVNVQRANLLDQAAPNPSVETLLHAWLPARYVDHTHATAFLALVPYIMPGFQLAKVAAGIAAAHPQAEGLLLVNHGHFTWGATARESYDRVIGHTALAEDWLARHRNPARPAVAARPLDMAALRGALASALPAGAAMPLLDLRGDAGTLAFLERPDLADLAARGVATPDHVIRTKAHPLLLDGGDLRAGVAAFAARYAGYFARQTARVGGGRVMLPPMPGIVWAPGAGILGVGATAAAARIAADIGTQTARVMAAGTAAGGYFPIAEDDTFDMEYWPLEQAKLGKGKPPALQGRIVLVTGGAGAIGLATAQAFAAEGAALFLVDRDAGALAALGRDHGGLATDITAPGAAAAAVAACVARFGGLDILVSNAGAAVQGDIATLDDAVLRGSFELNFFAHQAFALAAVAVFRAQGGPGQILINASKQAVNPGRGFGAYGLPKAATFFLVRQLALELGAEGIRVNGVNADRIRSGLLTDAMIASRSAARGLDTGSYMAGNLLRAEVEAHHVAAAFVMLAQAERTTAHVMTVDGGNIEAALR